MEKLRLKLNGKEVTLPVGDNYDNSVVGMFKSEPGLTKLVRTVYGEKYVWERIVD